MTYFLAWKKELGPLCFPSFHNKEKNIEFAKDGNA
jgi:hypothetical protein